MGSHLWSFQKWFQTDGTPEDLELARKFIEFRAHLGEFQIHEIRDALIDLLCQIGSFAEREIRAMEEEEEYYVQLVGAFITSCYGELISVTEDAPEQLACMLTAVRTKERFLPRDHLYGGRAKACATCNRSVEEIASIHHGPGDHRELSDRLPEEKPSRHWDLVFPNHKQKGK